MLDLLLPMRCVVCEREGQHLCDACEPALPRLKKPYCRICASPRVSTLCQSCRVSSPPVDGIRAPYLMTGAVRQMVHDLKYRNIRASAPLLGRLLAEYLASEPIPADLVTPVPLHPRRVRERGYSQSELLARSLCKQTGAPLERDALRRVRNTPPQVSLDSDEERRRNMEEAFECADRVAGLRVLLVDDVVTTGSTMMACATALKAAGAQRVWGLALAR